MYEGSGNYDQYLITGSLTDGIDSGHFLLMGSKRRNCVQCYENLRQTMDSSEAKRKVKKIKTYCYKCKQSLCRNCYRNRHVPKNILFLEN